MPSAASTTPIRSPFCKKSASAPRATASPGLCSYSAASLARWAGCGRTRAQWRGCKPPDPLPRGGVLLDASRVQGTCAGNEVARGMSSASRLRISCSWSAHEGTREPQHFSSCLCHSSAVPALTWWPSVLPQTPLPIGTEASCNLLLQRPHRPRPNATAERATAS